MSEHTPGPSMMIIGDPLRSLNEIYWRALSVAASADIIWDKPRALLLLEATEPFFREIKAKLRPPVDCWAAEETWTDAAE